MAERPLYTLYKNLKAQNYDVPDDYNKFESALTRDGKSGADNRHAIYENLKAQNFDVPSTYERFYSALFVPRSKTSSRAKGGSVPMSAADRARFSAGAAAISASAKQIANNAGRYNRLKQRKQKQQKDFGRVNLGTHLTPFGGDANNVVKDEFAYNPKTGKAGAYVTSDNENAYTQSDAEQKQAILDQQDAAYQQAVDTGEIPSVFDVRDKKGNYDLQENINKNGTYLTEEGAQKQFDKKLADAYARKKEIEALIAEDNRQHGNPLLSYSASIGAGNGRTAEQSDYRNKLATSLSLVTEQIGALEAVKQYPTSSWGEDVLKALDNTVFTAKTWDFGLTDFATMGQIERIKIKMDNNIPLSGSDKMLLKSKLGADAAAALEDEKMGNIYRWTKIAGQSLSFMTDFLLTGGYGGITKGISRGALKYAAKRGMGKVSAAILKNTGIVAGDVIGSYAMAGTEQALKTGADIMQRHLGNLYQDEKGDYKFGTFDENGNLLHEGGESIGTALYKGLTSAMVENYTEKLFGHNYGIKKGAIAAMEKHGMDGTAQFFKNIGKSGWYTNSKKWMEKFGINGFGEEVMEEEIGIPLHALLDGDNNFSDLGDAKQQLDIIGGMAISVGSMYAMGAGSRPVKGIYNRAQYYRFRNKVNVADIDAQNLIGDNWADIKDKIDNATNEQMGGVLADILRQRDTMTKEQINAAVNYGVNLMKMRGYNIAKTAEMNAKEITNEPTTPEEQHQADIDNAYSEGHDADDADKHDIQIQQEDQMKTLAAALGISEQQLSAMSDEELESLTGQDDKLDQAIYDYQLSSARYQGVVDDAQDKVDLAAHQAEQRVDMFTDQNRGSVRNATIKASGGLEDYGVYIISGNIATHDDGSIDVSNSDDMILYYDPTKNSVEHADALMFAELGEELPADDVKAQAVADAKENAIKEIAGIIDGTVEVGSQFNVTDTDGTEHTYEVLADYGDGTAAISIDGNVVENPYSLADLQQMKDLEDQKRLEAAKAQREQLEKERADQQTQETEETQPSFDFNQILNDNGNVVLVDVLDEDGNTKYPDSKLFLIRDTGAKAKVVELKSDGTIVPHAVNKEDVATISSMSLDEYKQAMPESSMIEDNSGEESDEDSQLANLGLPKGSEIWMSGDGFGRPKENTLSRVVGIDEQGSIVLEDKDGKKWSASFDYINNHRELPPLDENANQSESNAEENTPAPKQTPAMTLEDGTIVPMLEDGNPDFSKLTAAQTAELYDSQFGDDADNVISGWVSDAKKELDKANNMTVKGKTFLEQKASKDAKEKAIADAQAAYDSAIAIRDAYNERQLAKVEDTAEGRKKLIEKARRKFARLKSAVKDDAEAVAQIYKETVGSLLHRLYDGTGIDVTDTIPLTAEEYVASNLGAHSLNYEGTETSKSVKQETGLSREDFAKTQLLAADGKGTTIDALVHSLWDNRPSNLESLDTQDIRNALIDVLTSGFKASEARSYIENIRIAQAEKLLEEQELAAENAAYAEQQKAKEEEEKKKAEEENEKINEQTNENINAPELSHEQQKAMEEGEKLGFPAIDKEGEPINEYVIELANWAKEQGLEIDPTSKSNSYADLFLMCKDGFGVSTLVPDEGENINQVVYFPDNVQDFDQLWKLQEEFNAGRDLKHSSNIDSEITEGATFYDADTAREFKEFVDKKVEEQNKVFGEQRPEEDLPFSARDNGKQQTTSERAADVEKNKVDDMKVVDNIVGQKTRKAFERLAKMMGANIQWQYSDKLGNGWIQETTDADGNVHRTIFITLDSSITEGAQFIFGHEMTHQIKNLNPATYNELTQLVLDTYGSDAFDKAVDETMQRYSDAGFSGRDRDYYAEEVVADAVGEMIRDLNLAHTLAMKMSHPLLAAIHEILQKIKLAFFGTEYSDVTKNIIRSIEQAYVKTANREAVDAATQEGEGGQRLSLRTKPEPKKTQKVYKLMRLGEDGKLYPLFIGSGEAIELGKWYDADSPKLQDLTSLSSKDYVGTRTAKKDGASVKEEYHYGAYIVNNKTGEAMSLADFKAKYSKQFARMGNNPNKKAVDWATDNGYRWIKIEEKNQGQSRYGGEARSYYNYGINGSGSVSIFAMRPGWHAGSLPTMRQIGKGSAKNLRDDTFVWVEGEIPAEIDYNEEAQKNADKDIPDHIPTDGYYLKATNANKEASQADKVGWYVAGAFRANRIMSDKETRDIIDEWNAAHPDDNVDYDWKRESGKDFNAETMSLEDTPKFSLKVYHGSGADFTEFDFDHMGEGAGSQAFGWGGYVTSSKKIGKNYATLMDNDPSRAYYRIQHSNGTRFAKKYPTLESFLHGDKQIAMNDKFTEHEKIDFYNEMKKLAEPYHNLYEVDIPEDNGSNYLDWDKPLSKNQQDAIREGLEHLGVGIKTLESKGQSFERTGEDVYNSTLYIGLTGTEYDLPEKTKGISKFLSSVGFTGIKYKAGRYFVGAKKGDVNYVIFKPEDMKITEHTKFSIKTYHGSQASFDHFDHSFMGSGEGAQAYGWGTYVSEVEGIAKAYAKQNARKHKGEDFAKAEQTYDMAKSKYDDTVRKIADTELEIKMFYEPIFERTKKLLDKAINNNSTDLIKRFTERVKETENDLNEAQQKLDNFRSHIDEYYNSMVDAKKKYDSMEKPKRNLYTVDIPDDTGDNYIGWDEPLTEKMYDAEIKILESVGYKVNSMNEYGTLLDNTKNGGTLMIPSRENETGGSFYKGMAEKLGSQKAASLALKDLGFVGVKVIAQRNTGGNKEGNMNYVIFDEDNAQITNHTKFSLRLKSAIEDTKTNPSDAQKESGNYKKGHIKFGGYDYTIENPKGSTRSGKDANGKEWKVTMHDTYGYIRGKFGKDGDHLDMFINDKADLDNWDGDVFVVDQVNPDGSFDEHKVMYGYDSMDDAEKAYLANYSKGWQGLGNITGASKAEFDKWLDTSNRKLKPFADYAKVKFSQAQSVSEPRYSFKDIKPVGVGAFGNIYNQFRGKAKAAIEFLKKLGSGEATAALHHHTIGDISLVWGDKKTGLDKILRKHPEVVDNLQSIIDSMEVVQESDNRIKLESPTHFAVVSKEYKGEPREQWLLTAYEKRESLENDKSMDTATSSLGGDTALSQSKGSAAKIDNSSETSKENGEKFSLKDEKTMFGMHNISLDKLRKAIKQGGFAAPSMGVIDSKNGIYSGYGEITLIPKAEKIAKRTGKNIGTYAADAWTPIYPPVEKKFGGNGGDVAYDDIESVPKEMQRLTRNAINSFMDGREANGLAYLYLQEKGKAPELVHVEGKYPKELHDEVKGILGKLNGIYNTTDEQKEKLLDLFIREVYDGNKEEFDNDIKKFIKKDEELIKKRPNSNIAKNKQLDVDWMKEHGYDYGALSRFVDGILRDAETSGKVDENATMKAAQQYIQDKGMKEDFDSWKEKLNDRYNVEEVIFAGYKPDGNRKYLPNTVENAVKVMKQDGKNASVGSASFSHFVASILKPMGTLDQIRKKKGNLTGNYEDVEKFQEKWQPVYDELADKMQPDAEPFESYGMDRLEEVATQKNPKKYAKEEYGVDLTDEDINKLNELIEAVKNDKPSIYFETKFMRPYGLDEFEKAIVPNDTPSDVVDALKMAGIDVSSYERGNAEDRQKVTMDAINSSDNIRFSLKSMMAKPEGWKQANKKAIHIAEAIERDPKFSLKNFDGTLIKAGTYFSGGGLVEEGLKGIIDPVVAVEYDEKISGVYRNNFGQHIVTADVRDVDPKELVKQIDGEVEYFHASPVCKNYSQAKSNHAEVELDKETAASTAEFINAVKPKVVTIENVKGYKDSDAMKTITDALDTNGYTWDADVYNAADYGGYTNRERLIVRAVRDGKLPAKPKKMAHKSGWYEAVADIIPTLTEKKNGVAPWMDIRLKADGIDWRNIDKPLYVMGSAYADGKIPHAFADELLPTLRTKSGDVIIMPDGKVYRAMGRVLARVSGVSDDYKMPFSENLSHTIIGNGIPTQLTEHVIAPLLTGSDPKFSIRTYHGTGASFDKFDLSHALEGEGSETFGHGVYVTNSSKIGREYAQRAKQRKMADLYKNMRYPDGVKGDIFKRRVFGEMVNDVATGGSVASAKEFAKKRVGADANDIQRTLENLKDREKGTEYEQNLKDRLAEYKEGLKWIDSIDEDYLTQGNANRYDVDIPDDNGDYIDWENKLKKSHLNKVNKELVRIGKEPIETIYPSRVDGKVRGQDLYDELSSMLGSKEAASKLLSDAGFIGIKYPAGTIHGDAEEDDYNYVIFDENNANIVGNTRFSLRYDRFEHDLNQWKKDNNLPKDAQRPTIPQRNAGENAVDFLRRVDEYRKQMALWKTAPTYEQHLLSDDTALGEFNRELQRGSVLKRIAFQDSMLAIRKAQEAIMKEVGVDRLNMAEDAYTAENRSHGKGKNEFEEYNNEFLQPLRKAYHQMKKVLGDSYDNVRIYMMAKHGLERDAQMAFKKSLEADYEDVAQRSAAYKAYKGDMNRIINDSDLEFGRVDFTTWRQRDNALRVKYSPSYMNYRYDKMGIAYDYSGLSALFDGSDFEEAAHKLVKDIESKYVAETHDLWDATNAATKKILRDGYKAGMMSKDTYQYVRDMYSHYIPLRGWDGTTADQVWDYIGGGKGAFNQTLKKAHGRTSIADDPIAYIENMAESGILLNNKNWVKQHLMLLAQNHPTSLLTLSKAWYVKSTDANGNEEWIPATPQITSQMNSNQVKAAIDAFEQKMEQMAQTGDATQKRDGLNIAYPQTHSEEREHEVRVMKDGEEYVIYVNGDPQLAQAMNNTRAHRVREIQSGKLDRAAAWLGRKMAAAYTSLSPLFIPSNYFRDLTMTLASTAIREDGRYNYLLRKNLATSWNLGFMLKDYQSGKLREKVSNGNATPKEQMFYDFMMNGGETGFVSSLDVEDLKKKFKNDLKDLDRWKTNPVKVGHTIMDGIEFLNRAIEDSNRFAVYMTSIQYGRSIDEAVNDAKDVTLNFNRKGTGEYGWQMIRNLYLFINPAVQSLQTLGALVKHHPFKFTAVTASWLASGVLVPIVNAALMSLLGGDDDKDKYWQFTKWDRRNNLIMWVPFTHEYVKIPLAQEFRAFYGVGDMIASKMMGGELAEESWSQYAEDLLGQVVDMLPLDPTGYDGNIAVSLMPNAIRPVFELAFNVDFTGKPLFKDTEYNKYDPNFTKAYVGTPDWLVRASKMVNSIGNDYPDVQQNSIDAFGDPRYNLNNPAVVDHVLSSYLGGAYTMGSQVLGILTKSLNDPKEIKVADIPLFSKFVSNPDDRPVTKKQGDEFWNMKENHDRAANTLSKLKKQAKVDGDYSMLERFYGSEEYKQYKQDDVKVKKYEEDKKKERAEESGEEYRPHKLNAEDIYKAHATPKDDFEDLKLKQLYTKLNGFKISYDLLVDTAPSQSDGYYNTNKAAIDAINEISLDKQKISELKKGFLDDGKHAYNAEDMKQIRELRKKILAVLEKANKVVVANQKANAKKK
jgi:site-specific DNA-cytosine methylase